MKDFHPETLRKIKKGLLVLCDCGTAHSGRYEKCAKCLTRVCTVCNNSYRKGTDKLCSSCNKKRIKKAEFEL